MDCLIANGIFLQGYLFQALSMFSFVCWAAPKNVPVNQLFGVRSGMGMSILTFDWTQISWIGSPLMSECLFDLISFFFGFYFPFTLLFMSSLWRCAGIKLDPDAFIERHD